MKKAVKLLCLTMALVCLCAALAGCSNISQDYADKINKASEEEKHLTYVQVLQDLGDEAVDITALQTGVIIAVKGCKSVSDIQTRLDEGKTVEGIIVTVRGGMAISASYRAITKEDLSVF